MALTSHEFLLVVLSEVYFDWLVENMTHIKKICLNQEL